MIVILVVIPVEDAMMSIVQARVRVIRLYLAEVEEGKVDYWRLIRIRKRDTNRVVAYLLDIVD